MPSAGSSTAYVTENLETCVTPLKAVRSVKFRFVLTSSARELLETFREMVNHAIYLCLEENIIGRLKLRDRIYKEFQDKYGVVSCDP